jgi:hypothetical protein
MLRRTYSQALVWQGCCFGISTLKYYNERLTANLEREEDGVSDREGDHRGDAKVVSV